MHNTSWFLVVFAFTGLTGTTDRQGYNIGTVGSVLNVTATPYAANGYICTKTVAFTLDGANVNPTTNAGTSCTYNVPSQTLGSMHVLIFLPIVGWGCTASGTTNDGYSSATSGNAIAYTRSGSNTKWYLDGNLVYTGTSYTVPAQTNGTTHTLSCTT